MNSAADAGFISGVEDGAWRFHDHVYAHHRYMWITSDPVTMSILKHLGAIFLAVRATGHGNFAGVLNSSGFASSPVITYGRRHTWSPALLVKYSREIESLSVSPSAQKA